MQGEKTFANARNSASGTLRMLDSAVVAARRLDMFPYDVFRGRQKMFATHWENFIWLEKNGFNVNPNRSLCANFDELTAFINEMETKRDDLDYEIDGVVPGSIRRRCRWWSHDKGFDGRSRANIADRTTGSASAFRSAAPEH